MILAEYMGEGNDFDKNKTSSSLKLIKQYSHVCHQSLRCIASIALREICPFVWKEHISFDCNIF